MGKYLYCLLTRDRIKQHLPLERLFTYLIEIVVEFSIRNSFVLFKSFLSLVSEKVSSITFEKGNVSSANVLHVDFIQLRNH